MNYLLMMKQVLNGEFYYVFIFVKFPKIISKRSVGIRNFQTNRFNPNYKLEKELAHAFYSKNSKSSSLTEYIHCSLLLSLKNIQNERL